MKRALLAAVAAGAVAAGAAAASSPSLLHPSSLHAKAPAVFQARFTTTKGPFVITVHRKWAPRGADRFYNLVRAGFYDGQRLFRVVPGFVVQWGISGSPKISHAWQNATIRDDPVRHTNARGTIDFADAGPNTRTTQVFVNLAANAQLDSSASLRSASSRAASRRCGTSIPDTEMRLPATRRRWCSRARRSSASTSRSSTGS